MTGGRAGFRKEVMAGRAVLCPPLAANQRNQITNTNPPCSVVTLGWQVRDGAHGVTRPTFALWRWFAQKSFRMPVWIVSVAVLLLAGNSIAQENLPRNGVVPEKLTADLIPLGLRARNNASVPVEARFKWTGTRVLEGKLELEFLEGNRVLGRYRTDDLALTTGEERFRILVPPLLQPSSDPQIEVRMKFVTADQVMNLDSSSLSLPTSSERSVSLGWCNARVDSAPHAPELEQSLMLERFSPQLGPSTYRQLLTSMTRLGPEDLPMQPLSYTTFDVMVLTAEGFADAHEGQLQTLARWVKGGGSVCVFVGGGLQAHHLAFLNELIDTNFIGPVFMADNTGNLLPGMKKISCLHSGVGRSVIVTGNIQPDPGLDSPAWREAVAFLWKVRDSQKQIILETGHWDAPTNYDWQASFPSQPYQYSYQRRVYRGRQPGMAPVPTISYGIQPSLFGSELVSQLMPKTVRLIPFPALLCTFGLFLLMIGPADYFLLGWFRRRRYTWVLFPVMSIVFTVGTVMMANHFLGLHDQRRSLIVVDLDKDGTPVRANRYELVFAARNKQSVNEMKDALWAPLNADAEAEMNPIAMPMRFNPRTGVPIAAAEPLEEAAPPWYDGTVPAHFRTTKPLRQWRPELNRVFSLDGSTAPLLANWSAIEEAWPNLQDIRAKLSANKPFAGDVCAISIADPGTFGPGTTEVDPSADDPEPQVDQNGQPIVAASPWRVSFDSGSKRILLASTLSKLCVGDPSFGLRALLSQMSPTGGGNFEDGQVMDTTDSALTIVTEVGEDIVVYRRIFHAN